MNTDYEKHPIDIVRPSSSGSDKIGAKRKRMTGTPHRRHQLPEDIPWTAARCNRLLRAITSRIQILRRLSENNFADKAATRKSPARRKIVFLPDRSNGGRVSPEGIENVRSSLAALPTLESPSKEGNDPDWLPDDGRKPTQRTYAGKGGKARKVKSDEQSLPARSSSTADFHSPFIKRLLRTDPASSPTANIITDTPRRLTSQKIVLDPKTHSERALRTLLEAFDKVLSTTTSPQHGRRAGAKSLRNMCLRKVPEYIDFEQKFAYDEEEYDFDATETIYVDLEKHGNGGWEGLREVTRAHAVKMIADAMDERSWPVESLDRLLEVCERNQAVAEGQQILRSWFEKSEGRASDRMARLLAWSKILDCTGYFFGVLCDLLERGQLHMHEFTECPSLWQDLVKALARRSSRSNAAQFLEAYTLTCVRLDSEIANGPNNMTLHERLKRDEVLQNIMVLVTALSWTSDESISISTSAAECLSTLVQRMAINASQCNNPQVDEADQTAVTPRKTLHSTEPLLMSSIVLQALNANTASGRFGSRSTDTTWHDLVARSCLPQHLSNQEALRSSRAQFVCSTAKCIAHISQVSANGFVKDISSSLLSLAEHRPEQVKSFLKQSAVDITAAWANYRCDNESYTFADEVERAAFHNSPNALTLSPRSSTHKPVEYKWEETIEEWVAMTPLSGAPPQKLVFPETRDPEGEGSEDNAFAESGPIVESAPRKTSGESTEALGQWTESPLQAKASRCASERLTQEKSTVEYQSTATLRNVEPGFGGPPPVQTTLTIRARSPLSGFMDRDELAMTPAKQHVDVSMHTEVPEPITEPSAPQNLNEERDELAATPARVIALSTRQLRSAKHQSTAALDKARPMEIFDELAMTPAQRVVASPRKTKATRQITVQTTQVAARMERDELGVTPLRSRVSRSRSTKARGTKSRHKVELADVHVLDEGIEAPTQAIEKSTNLPFGARSANARTAAKTLKGGVSDDELGL